MIAGAWHWGATLGSPALGRMLERRVAAGKEEAARLGERRGIDGTERPAGRLLWLHAASVGETVSVLPLLSSLCRRDPALSVLFTTGTVTSAELLRTRLPQLGLDRVVHRFVPLDVPAWAARFLDHWRPDAAAFVESELWPNLLHACQRRRIPVMLVNARMSARSLHRWRWAGGFARQVIGAFDRVHAQSDDYARRLHALGARGLLPAGNLKAAAPTLPFDGTEAARLRRLIAGRPVWLAANTHDGEEAVVAGVHRRLAAAHGDLLTIVAPRHPARGEAVAAEFAAPRRALGQDPGDGGFWVVDTLGELGLAYALAPLVFVGGSLRDRGGHNPFEAARFDAALAIGPYVANCEPAVAALQAAGALTRVADEAALAGWLDAMLRDEAGRALAGRAAGAVASGGADLPDRVAAALLELLPR